MFALLLLKEGRKGKRGVRVLFRSRLSSGVVVVFDSLRLDEEWKLGSFSGKVLSMRRRRLFVIQPAYSV